MTEQEWERAERDKHAEEWGGCCEACHRLFSGEAERLDRWVDDRDGFADHLRYRPRPPVLEIDALIRRYRERDFLRKRLVNDGPFLRLDASLDGNGWFPIAQARAEAGGAE